MFRYSQKSLSNLHTCEPDLVRVFKAILKHRDHSILEGARTKERQEWLVSQGRSKTMNSKHVVDRPGDLARAVDVMPYPYTWEFEGELYRAIRDKNMVEVKRILHWIERWAEFAGYVQGTATAMGIPLRWGGDWDRDADLRDQNFDDWPHFELV